MQRLSLSFLLGFLLITPLAWSQSTDNTVWIDVRTPSEFAEGHLEGATLIPWDGIETGIRALKLEKDTPIVLYCGSGGRAERAREALQATGYSAVVNAGGLEEAQALKSKLTEE
ncbi:MAG: rhodanese-like domain-containing protein [Halioglobus sp.]